MVYHACGTGRDSFIFLHEETVKGRQHQPKVLYSDAERLTSFWKNKDKQSELMQTGALKPKERDTFPSKKSLRATTHEDELAQRRVQRTGSPIKAARDEISIITHRGMPESEKTFRLEKLKEVPARIPGYSGHIPCARETIGVSATSNKFLEQVTTRAVQEETIRHKITEKRLAEETITRMNRTLDLPSFQRMNRVEAKQAESLLREVGTGSIVSPQKPVKVTRKPQVDLPTPHHIPGFAGHQPRSLHTLRCYEKNKQGTTF